MESNQLNTQEVLPRRNATRKLKVHLPLILDQLIHSPLSTPRVQSVLVDLEPLESSHIALRRIVDLGQIRHDRALMRGVNGVGAATGRTIEVVVPLRGELCPGWHLNYGF